MDLAKPLNLKILIAYDGTRYFGWQKTRMGPSIEESLQAALEQYLHHPVALQAASRTDRGVHAQGQVVNFFTQVQDLKKLEKALRAILPVDISLVSLEEAPFAFHPTLDVTGKEYHYQVCNTAFQSPFHRAYSWHFRYPLDFELMEKAAQVLVGTHDFSAFSNERLSSEEATRTLTRISILPLPQERLRIEVAGNNFLYRMVRNLVGTLVYIGCGKISFNELPSILSSRNRELAGMTAPAHGLCLKQVFYPIAPKTRPFIAEM